jgi:hypothetical protein
VTGVACVRGIQHNGSPNQKADWEQIHIWPAARPPEWDESLRQSQAWAKDHPVGFAAKDLRLHNAKSKN